jgi:hypothetical protein
VEVQRHPRVVPLNYLARGLLHSLGTYTTHFRELAVPARRRYNHFFTILAGTNKKQNTR